MIQRLRHSRTQPEYHRTISDRGTTQLTPAQAISEVKEYSSFRPTLFPHEGTTSEDKLTYPPENHLEELLEQIRPKKTTRGEPPREPAKESTQRPKGDPPKENHQRENTPEENRPRRNPPKGNHQKRERPKEPPKENRPKGARPREPPKGKLTRREPPRVVGEPRPKRNTKREPPRGAGARPREPPKENRPRDPPQIPQDSNDGPQRQRPLPSH
nr:basic salivary proline-rich protein 4-like [Penaeus vannamei]